MKSLRTNRAVLDNCAAELLERETLDAPELAKLTEALRKPAKKGKHIAAK